MVKFFILLFVCLYFGCLCRSSAQVQEKGIPKSVNENLPTLKNFEHLILPDSSLCNGKAAHSREVSRFACPVFTDFNPVNSGEWTETKSGSIWRLGIWSDNAFSLYISMKYMLSPGASLYVYGPGYRHLRGAFTHKNNNGAGVFSIAPIPGDSLIIELNLPGHQTHYGTLGITKVYHDYLNIFNEPAMNSRAASIENGCGEDINCKNGIYWQTEKRSVCKIISNGGIGTGTLVGNTSKNNTPYLITANHLIYSEAIAAEAMFLFNYESNDCGEGLSTTDHSLFGATLVSTTNDRLDYSLLKLNDIPPPSYQPFYAGWDAGNAIPQSGTCIHHPFGGPKQIAIEYHPLIIEDAGKGYEAGPSWKVAQWELGTTEVGSSGAPLFNEDHRLVGTLSAGRSTCGYAKDDYFTRFGNAWKTYPAPSNQLRYWLDSAQTGQLVLDGYDPYGFNEDYCAPAWNFTSHDQLGLSSKDLDWGWMSGHNSRGYTQFAERFELPGKIKIKGVYLNVARANAADPLAYIEVKVWGGDQFPEEEYYAKMLFINELKPGKENYVAFDSVLSKSGSLFIGYKINYRGKADTFALFQTLGKRGGARSSMYVYKESWKETRELDGTGFPASLGIGISECYGKSRSPAASILNVFPNPASNSIYLDIPASLAINEVKCYDSRGSQVPVNLEQSEAGNTLNFGLLPGLYFLKIFASEKTFFARFIVL